MGFPTDMFPLLFTIPRVAGWLAHWNEFLDDPENRIVRPRQNYQGHNTRSYTPMTKRDQSANSTYLECDHTATSKRN
jgi:citrate synthase